MGKACNNFESFDRDYFKKHFCKNDSQIEKAEEILGSKVEAFYDHYIETHYEKLVNLSNSLSAVQFKMLSDLPSVNSLKTRVKDPYHFIDKLVRKVNKSSEYQNINFDNYHMYFDDLLGFRLIMLYTEDWYGIHNAIINQFPCDETRFLGKSDRSESDISQPFVIAKPEINIRNGDIESIYSSRFSDPLTNHFVLKKGRYYRSIHYSVYSGHYCFEIQVRSVYDEAWSEVDHDVLYPQYLGNKRLIQFSGMLNRLAGLSNEMSSFFKTEIVESLTKNYTPVSTLDRVPNEIELQKTGSTKPQTMSAGKGNSVGDIINNLIRGDKI